MKSIQRNTAIFVVAFAMAPANLLAADAAPDENSGHHPEQAQQRGAA